MDGCYAQATLPRNPKRGRGLTGGKRTEFDGMQAARILALTAASALSSDLIQFKADQHWRRTNSRRLRAARNA